ncbi:hypothetical protein [Alkaliphilus sp. B6464]|uniref:hypothetical protein n=1 Tax=Alkaliphilus sp. B6464 TaxID=2731219 RepID=UPI001BAC63AE|nr:hypothetical protein [Alkaliphilus sp. B6464]QUH22141.1 hypothetical protein HYG84_19735 [Alkaliphilus sp. B6464]
MKHTKILSLIILLILLISLMPTQIFASNNPIIDMSYTEYRQLDEIIQRISYISHNQRIMKYRILSKWDIYTPSEQERYEDVKEYINYAKDQLSIIDLYKYKSKSAEKINTVLNQYRKDLDNIQNNYNSLYAKDADALIYIGKKTEVSNLINFYQEFKDTKIKLLYDKYIYQNNNRVAIKKIKEGSANEKKEGIEELQNTIAELKKIRDNNDNFKVIRGYAEELIIDYTAIINGKEPDILRHVSADKLRIETLISIAQVNDKAREFGMYSAKFTNFLDFPTKELALEVKSNQLNKMVEVMHTSKVKTPETIKLKNLHYDLVYSIANYKNKKSNGIDEAWQKFFLHYDFLSIYFNDIYTEFGANITPEVVQNEISSFHSNLSFISLNPDKYMNRLTFKPEYKEDITEYRKLAISDGNVLLKFVPYALIFIFLLIAGFIVIKAISANKNRDDYYDNYNDYY